MPIVHSLPNARKKLGLFILLVSSCALVFQFFDSFSGIGTGAANQNAWDGMLKFFPYLLLLMSLYLLFGKANIPSDRRVLSFFLKLTAGFGLAGAIFVAATILALFVSGPDAVNTLFNNMFFIIGGLLVATVPFIAKWMK